MGQKYSGGLPVDLNQAIPAGGGGALSLDTSWVSCFSAMCLQLHAGHQAQNY